jgi:hypothetical protein
VLAKATWVSENRDDELALPNDVTFETTQSRARAALLLSDLCARCRIVADSAEIQRSLTLSVVSRKTGHGREDVIATLMTFPDLALAEQFKLLAYMVRRRDLAAPLRGFDLRPQL